MMPVQMYGVGVKQIELLLKVQARIMLIKKENQQRFSFQRSVWVTYILESCQHVDLC